jgi:hypothetical protein
MSKTVTVKVATATSRNGKEIDQACKSDVVSVNRCPPKALLKNKDAAYEDHTNGVRYWDAKALNYDPERVELEEEFLCFYIRPSMKKGMEYYSLPQPEDRVELQHCKTHKLHSFIVKYRAYDYSDTGKAGGDARKTDFVSLQPLTTD